MDAEHGSGSSKHSRKHHQDQAVEDSGSSRHSKTDSDEIEKRQDIDVQTEMLPLVFDSGESIEYTVTHHEDDDMIDLGHRTSSSSSSSSNSSLEDLFQVTFSSINPDNDDVQLTVRKDDENDVTSNGSSTIITSTSQVSDLTHESLLLNLSPAQSPPSIQVMEHRGDYNPDRIPASIFASKSSSPLEWSTASNESLFSIHVGNSSFSKDQFIMMGANLSGELTKSGELLLFSPTPPVKIVEVDRKSIEREPRPPNIEPSIMAYESNKKDDLKESTAVYQHEVKMVPKRASLLSSSNSKQSEASGGSTHSFEFPILADGMESGLLKKEDSVRQKDELPPPAASKWTITCHCFSCFSWCHYPRCSCCCS